MIGAFDLLKVLSVTSLARVLVARAGGFKGWDADRGLDGAAKWPSNVQRMQIRSLPAIANLGQKMIEDTAVFRNIVKMHECENLYV